MKTRTRTDHIFATLLVAALLVASCGKSPKVIAPEEGQAQPDASPIFSREGSYPVPIEGPAGGEGVHEVVVQEVLPTTRYVYLRVTEGSREYWLATNKMEVTVGATYYYQDGLLKTNFESKEHGRIFDELYLVSTLVDTNHGGAAAHQESSGSQLPTPEIKFQEGTVRIADLVKNAKSYEGKVVQVQGTCVKLNPNIMGRNWIHLQDGTKNDFDLVVTCDLQIPVGHTVVMTGKVALKKDFGSGYFYDIILEEGTVLPH